MHVLVPLLLIFVALNGKQLRKDKLYRANVFAIVGICYFFLLQYIYYWYRVFPVEGWTQSALGAVVVLGAVGASLAPWTRRSHPLKTIVLCSLFVISLVVTYGFDIKVKEWLAEKGGFFKGGVELSSKREVVTPIQKLEFSSVGIEVGVSSGWEKSELPSGHEYLIYQNGDAQRMEVRPNCLDGKNIDTPTYIFNMLDLLEAGTPNVEYEYQCGLSEEIKMCLIKVEYSSNSKVRQKWHWFKESVGNRAIAMDFIMSDGSETLEGKAMNLMASARILRRRKTGICHTPAAWL